MMETQDVTPAGASEDAFLAGRVRVLQPVRGFRAGLDSVLLAASLQASAGERLVEAGCGAGAALLCAAFRLDEASFTGVERDPGLVDLARRGVARNGFDARVTVIEADVAGRGVLMEGGADQGFANPPFFEPGAVSPPGPGREGAYLADAPLRTWVLFLLDNIRRGGRITLIHRAQALPDVLGELARRTGEIEVMPVRPHPGAPARRVLVRARKGLRKGAFILYNGLTLHEFEGGPPTQETADLMAGAALNWR